MVLPAVSKKGKSMGNLKEYSKDNADKEKELFEMYLKLKNKFENNEQGAI